MLGMPFAANILSLILLFTQCLAVPRPGVPALVFSNTTTTSGTDTTSTNTDESQSSAGSLLVEETGIVSIADGSTLSALSQSSTTSTEITNPGGPLIPVVTPPPFPLGTAVSGAGISTVNIGTGSASLLVTQNSSCGSCTVNVDNADLFFWLNYTVLYNPSIYKTVGMVNSTLSFTKVPNPTPFSFDASGLGANHVETVLFTPPTDTQTFTDLTDIGKPPTTQTIAAPNTALPPSQVVAPGFTA
ncbi:MAG: hypothetical protein Q9227_008454 [Pyrenula ochraceoflavens]